MQKNQLQLDSPADKIRFYLIFSYFVFFNLTLYSFVCQCILLYYRCFMNGFDFFQMGCQADDAGGICLADSPEDCPGQCESCWFFYSKQGED